MSNKSEAIQAILKDLDQLKNPKDTLMFPAAVFLLVDIKAALQLAYDAGVASSAARSAEASTTR